MKAVGQDEMPEKNLGLKEKLVASKFDAAARELDKLRSDIVADVKKDFKTYKTEITEDLEQNILAR